MKNLFRFAMAVAVLFTASCAKEDISSSIGGGEVEVTFTANLADMGTRAYGEANNVDVVFLGIYDQNGNYLDDLTVDGGYPVDPVSHTASIPVVLLKDKTYDLVFWAQHKAQEGEVSCYTMNWTARKMSVSYTGAISQDDTRDAFFLVDNDFVAGEEKNPEFRLYRPFAQLNAGLSADEVTKIGKNGVDVSKIKSQVVVKNVASTLNLIEEATATAIDVADFVDASFIIAAKPKEALKVSNVEYEYLSMNYLLVDTKRNVDVEYLFTDADNTPYARNYYNVPLQRNYRTNIVGNLLSSEYDFNVIIVPGFDGDENLDAKTQIFDVATDAELLEALTTKVEDHIEHVVINLNADVTLDVNARDVLAVGKKLTKDITINGSKTRSAEYYTLTFNNLNSDWNNVATKGAKLILNNLNITNSGKNNGPWNRHDLNFACDVEMNNVVSDKALAFKAGATLKNTTITEDNTSDVYAIWIQPNGQTVTIENCTINTIAATDGRGIKIDEQYVENPKKVTLNISGTSFATEEKAAIVVKSSAGAEINASNLDIANVAADSKYAVWVDEGAAAYYNLVEVTGALVRLEGSAIVANQQELEEAIDAGKKQINLAAGNYNLPAGAKGAIVGTDKTNCVVNIVKSVYGTSADVLTLQNLTTKLAAGFGYTEHAFGYFHHYKEVNIINCNADRIRLNCAKANIEDCTFTLTTSSGFDGYGIYYYGNANSTVNVKDCVFNTAGKAIVIYSEHAKAYNLNVDNCEFISSNPSTDKAAIQMHTEYGISGVLKINNCTANGFAAVNGGLWNELNNGSKELTNKFEKYVDGVQVYNDYTVSNGVYNIYTAAGLAYAATNLYKTGATINIEKDIDMTGVAYTPVVGAALLTVDGKGHTISNLKMEGVTQAALFADTNNLYVKNLTIANSTFVGKNIDGEDSAAAFVGFVEKHSSTESKIENCHVVNCTIGSAKYTGGLVGYKDGTGSLTVKDCSVKNSTIVSKYTENNGVLYKGHCGGLVGYYANPLAIDNCSVENNTFDVLGARCGLFIGSAQTDIQVSGSVKGNVGLSSLTGEINKITDWSNVNVQ